MPQRLTWLVPKQERERGWFEPDTLVPPTDSSCPGLDIPTPVRRLWETELLVVS
jgi:hypothetical protein